MPLALKGQVAVKQPPSSRLRRRRRAGGHTSREQVALTKGIQVGGQMQSVRLQQSGLWVEARAVQRAFVGVRVICKVLKAYHGPPMGAVHCATSGLLGSAATGGGLRAGGGMQDQWAGGATCLRRQCIH